MSRPLNSCNSVVHSVSRNGMYGMRMHSPIGANVQFSCNYYGMSPNDIPYVSKRLAWTVLWNSVIALDLDKISLIKELLSLKFHKGQISQFCESEVDFMMWFYVLHNVLFVYFCIFISHRVFICVPNCTNFLINK